MNAAVEAPGLVHSNGGPPCTTPTSDTREPDGGTLTLKAALAGPAPPLLIADMITVAVPPRPGAVPGGMTHGANPAVSAPSDAGGATYVVVTAPRITVTAYAHTQAAEGQQRRRGLGSRRIGKGTGIGKGYMHR